ASSAPTDSQDATHPNTETPDSPASSSGSATPSPSRPPPDLNHPPPRPPVEPPARPPVDLRLRTAVAPPQRFGAAGVVRHGDEDPHTAADEVIQHVQGWVVVPVYQRVQDQPCALVS